MQAISVIESLVPVERPSSNVVQLRLHGLTLSNFLNNNARRLAVQAINEAGREPSISAVILSGPLNAAFCAGGDVSEIAGIANEADVDAWLDSIIELYLAILDCPKPIIAAINGQAKGQGLQLALLCDVRVASYGTHFAEPELTQGVGCALGATILRHFVSYGIATEMVYGCREIGALTAMEYNLINAAVPEQDLIPTALHWAQRLAAYSKDAFAQTKRIIAHDMAEELKACLPAARVMHKQLLVARP